MNSDIKLMMKIYNTYDVDWMGDKISGGNPLTRHHIVKKENGGRDDISNYALLTEQSHRLLNFMEYQYYAEYSELNRMFLELNRSLCPPTSEYFIKVSQILKHIRREIKSNRNRNKSKKGYTKKRKKY